MESYEEDDQQQAGSSGEDLQTQSESKPALVNADGHMVIGGFTFTPTSLVPTDPDAKPNFEDWDSVGQYLRYIHTGTQFWLGDWLNYGESNYGEKYSQAVESTGYELHTLQTYAWVSRQVPRSNRNQSVPFGHYANGIAALNPDEQAKWVKKVAEEGMTQIALKTALAEERAKKGDRPVDLWLVVLCKNQADFDKLEKQMVGQGRTVTTRITPQKKVKADKPKAEAKGTKAKKQTPKTANTAAMRATAKTPAKIEAAGDNITKDEFWIDAPEGETPDQKKKRLKKINNARFRAKAKK